MIENYYGVFSDKLGEEEIEFASDGESLRTTIRGFEFTGHSFDHLMPTDREGVIASEHFAFGPNYSELLFHGMNVSMPFRVVDQSRERQYALHVTLAGYDPEAGKEYNPERLRLALYDGDTRIVETGGFDDFEGALLDLRATLLPRGAFMKNCFGCQFSDYFVAGNGFFGFMHCFKNLKDEYQAVRSKREYLDVMERYDRIVQETWLCPEFERRKPGTGYRG